MAKFITSDFHLGETRLQILGRPFNTTMDMISTLMRNHNSIVNEEDEVIIVGDVCYKEVPEYLKYLAGFNGKKTLIRGNHDRGITDEEFLKYFEKVIPDGDGLELEIEGIPCYATHYPTCGRKDRFTLCAHIHHAWRYQLNMFNIGVDSNHFLPVNLETIPFHFKAITEFYDEDVWCAYNEINSEYRGKRGKNGSYFKK